MNKQQLIDNLQFVIDMASYDPKTSKMLEKDELNHWNRKTYDACEAAIKYMGNNYNKE